MPDISMCQNDDCPMRKQCYRYTAKPNEPYQVYAEFEPDRCDSWWPNDTSSYMACFIPNFLGIEEDNNAN